MIFTHILFGLLFFVFRFHRFVTLLLSFSFYGSFFFCLDMHVIFPSNARLVLDRFYCFKTVRLMTGWLHTHTTVVANAILRLVTQLVRTWVTRCPLRSQVSISGNCCCCCCCCCCWRARLCGCCWQQTYRRRSVTWMLCRSLHCRLSTISLYTADLTFIYLSASDSGQYFKRRVLSAW